MLRVENANSQHGNTAIFTRIYIGKQHFPLFLAIGAPLKGMPVQGHKLLGRVTPWIADMSSPCASGSPPCLFWMSSSQAPLFPLTSTGDLSTNSVGGSRKTYKPHI